MVSALWTVGAKGADVEPKWTHGEPTVRFQGLYLRAKEIPQVEI